MIFLESRFLERAERWLFAFNPSPALGLLMLFVLSLVVRVIPEVLSYPYPIGFDTVYYGWRITEGVVWFHWSEVFSSWLLYGLLIPFHSLFGVDPFGLLKLAVPLLFSFNVAGMYFFARKALKWDNKMSLLTGFLLTFQLALLRISWEFHRNLLGMGFVLFALPFLVRREGAASVLAFMALSVLAGFSHEYAAITLIAISAFLVAHSFLRHEKKQAMRTFVAVLPLLFFFIMNVYFRIAPFSYTVEPNVTYVQDSVNPRPFDLFFLVDYLSVSNPIHNYASYFDLAAHVLTLFVVLYALLLPFVVAGFFRSKVLDGWSGLLVLGSFGALLVPFCALDLWYRWMLMLVYPFTFYAAMGFFRIFAGEDENDGASRLSPRGWLRRISFSKQKGACLVLVTVFVGALYVSSPLVYGRFGVFSVPGISSYFPSSMLANSVPVEDTQDVVRALEWLSVELSADSCVLIQEAFMSWSRLYLGREHKILLFTRDLSKATGLAVQQDFGAIYFVWWNESIGWYGVEVSMDYSEVFSSHRISVYKHV